VSSVPLSPIEEGEIIADIRGSGEAWNHSRWGHLG
jgi:hypothetical protein